MLFPDFRRILYFARIAIYEKAALAYEKALAIKPDRELAWYSKAYALERQGKTEAALAVYQRLLQIDDRQ